MTTPRKRIARRARAVSVAVSAAVVTLLVAPLGGTASGSVHPAVSCGTSWAMVPSSSTVKDPRGIAVISQNDVWVVGAQIVPSAKVHPAAEHWNGSTWTLVSTPYSGLGENVLNGVSAVGSNDVWAVGYWQPQKKVSAAFQTLTEHWDGTSWQVVPSPTMPSSGSNTLTSVSALNGHNVWAVGYYFDSKGIRKTLTEHYDGTSWSIVASPNPGGVSDALLAVTGSPTDVWAAGFTSAGYGYDALLMHYDGTSWTPVSGAADPSSAEDVLAGLAEDGSGNVWAFGYHVIGSDYRTLAEHWDGSSWSISPTTNGADGVVTVLRGGSVLSNDVWAAGFDYRISDGRYKEFTEHSSGGAWSSFPGAISTTKDKSEMYSIAHVPGTGQVWASARTAHLELICPGSLDTHNAVTRAGLASAGLPTAARGGGFHSVPGRAYRIPGIAHGLSPAAPAPTVSIPHATDVAGAAGIFENTLTHGAVTADFNGDGWPDIFLNRHMNPAKLYINDHDGTFTLTDFGTFPHRDRHGCSTADVNGDGRLDLFCNTGSDRGTEAKRDELWIQQANGNFTEKASQYGILQPFDRGRISGFIDADNDGRPDVYAANFPDRADGMPSSNRLFLNQGGTSYRLASEFGLDRELNGSTISVADYDNDGYQDLLLCGSGGIHLYHNDSGDGFTEVTKEMGLNHRANAAEFVDFDRDGKLDVAEVNKTRLLIDIQHGGTFEAGPVVSGLLSGFRLGIGDVNHDTWPDVYVEQANQGSNKNVPDVVFLNNGSGSGFDATSVTVPNPSNKGAAEDVVPIDFNKDGYMDFLVENGNSTKAGSVQLIEFTP